jgi:dienelactone hydrolase
VAGHLKAAGIEHEMITIPDGPHGFDSDQEPELEQTASDALDSVIAFLKMQV